MAEETKAITFDLDYQGNSYQSRYAAFGRSGDVLVV